MRIAILVTCCLLASCASTKRFVDRHPTLTAVGVAVIAGSIAASQSSGGSTPPPVGDPGQLPCTPQPNGSCR